MPIIQEYDNQQWLGGTRGESNVLRPKVVCNLLLRIEELSREPSMFRRDFSGDIPLIVVYRSEISTDTR